MNAFLMGGLLAFALTALVVITVTVLGLAKLIRHGSWLQ